MPRGQAVLYNSALLSLSTTEEDPLELQAACPAVDCADWSEH
jgi:hypothetical protein